MKASVNGRQIELEPNSKPYLLKRIIADGFDIFLIFVLFLTFTMLIMKTPLAETYHRHFDRYTAIENEVKEAHASDPDAIEAALQSNSEYQDEWFAANLYGYLLKAAACFLAEMPVLLLVPLLNRRRATPGKLMSGIMAFSERRQSRMTWYQALFRFLFVLLIDSLGLYLITGILTFLLVPVLRLTQMLLNKKNKTICDFLTGVTMIDALSYDGVN